MSDLPYIIYYHKFLYYLIQLLLLVYRTTCRAFVELINVLIFVHVQVSNEVSYNRMNKALGDLADQSKSLCAEYLKLVLFGKAEPRFRQTDKVQKKRGDIALFNTCLDNSQVEAIRFALDAVDVALIHGPPGTGKTTALTEYILQEVKRGNKVLVCSASNIAVDNVVERLTRHKVGFFNFQRSK